MKTRLATVALVLLLVLATGVLAFTLQGGGLGSASPNQGGGVLSQTQTEQLGPTLVIYASTVSDNYLYSSAALQQIPSSMLVPLTGLRVVVIGTQLNFVTRPGRPPTYVEFTNSSGVIQAQLPRGNYTVQAGGTDFNFTQGFALLRNATTVIKLTVHPAFVNVTSVLAVSALPSLQMGPSSYLYLDVQGQFSWSPYVTYDLTAGGGGSSTAAVSGTLSGSYPSPGGTWVIMTPSAPVQTPLVGPLQLMHMIASSVITVNSTLSSVGPLAS